MCVTYAFCLSPSIQTRVSFILFALPFALFPLIKAIKHVRNGQVLASGENIFGAFHSIFFGSFFYSAQKFWCCRRWNFLSVHFGVKSDNSRLTDRQFMFTFFFTLAQPFIPMWLFYARKFAAHIERESESKWEQWMIAQRQQRMKKEEDMCNREIEKDSRECERNVHCAMQLWLITRSFRSPTNLYS